MICDEECLISLLDFHFGHGAALRILAASSTEKTGDLAKISLLLVIN